MKPIQSHISSNKKMLVISTPYTIVYIRDDEKLEFDGKTELFEAGWGMLIGLRAGFGALMWIFIGFGEGRGSISLPIPTPKHIYIQIYLYTIAHIVLGLYLPNKKIILKLSIFVRLKLWSWKLVSCHIILKKLIYETSNLSFLCLFLLKT